MHSRGAVQAPITLTIDGSDVRSGYRVLAGILRMGQAAVDAMEGQSVALGRLRGTGPGVSCKALADELETALPRTLEFPFEGSARVGGAVWSGELLRPPLPQSLAKLRWEPGANDLPMHTHESSDRCIIVLEGRGFFHISDEAGSAFTGERVQTIAARERDVFVFRRGVVHTFSTTAWGMTLLSCQLPFVPFDDPGQYTLPRVRWIARDRMAQSASAIVLDVSSGAVLGSRTPRIE